MVVLSVELPVETMVVDKAEHLVDQMVVKSV
jgi:hypothetical protein